jgi:hypothetical protein
MQSWTQRPTEVAHLLNPAFCALVLVHAVRGFVEEANAGLPYPLIFLILPIVLHKATREALPNSVATKMHPWMENHQQVQVGFADRCASIIEHTREAMIFAVARNLLQVTPDARIAAPSQRLRQPSWPAKSEPAVCLEKARFIGRWIARAGQPATLYAMWGIRP